MSGFGSVAVVFAAVCCVTPVVASAAVMTVTATTDVSSERRSESLNLAGATDFKFSYDPQGPCWDHKVDPVRLPPPEACSAGFVDDGVGATTANCPNGACIVTNWMEAAHAAKVPWGCRGTVTPWLPFKVRKCISQTTTRQITMVPTARSSRVRVNATVSSGEVVEIRGSGTVYCAYPPAPPGSPIATPSVAQNKSLSYAAVNTNASLSIASLINECTSIPFHSATVTYTTHTKIDINQFRGPSVRINIEPRDMMQQVELRLSNIDDDAYLWQGSPTANGNAACAARYANNKPGTRNCNLTNIMRSRGVYSTQNFTLKFGNGGGWNSCGHAELWVNGSRVWTGDVGCAVRHTGWFYRAALGINFMTGAVTADARICGLPTDCMN